MLIFRAVFILLVLAILSIGVYMIALQSPNHKRCYKNKTENFEYVDNNNIEAGIKIPEINIKTFKLNDNDIFDLIYPIGSVYISFENKSPDKTFNNNSKWEQIKDSFLWCKGNDKTVDTIQGSLTISSDQLPKHLHNISINSKSGTNHTHTFSGTTSEIGDHAHDEYCTANENQGTGYRWTYDQDRNNLGRYPMGIKTGDAGAHTHTYSGTTSGESSHIHKVEGNTGETGGSKPYLPPFVQVYAWKRTG